MTATTPSTTPTDPDRQATIAVQDSDNATRSASTTADPVQTILTLAGGYALPRCLHTVAEFGVADALGEEPATVAHLAAAVSANPNALGRVLRLLSAHGVFALEGESVVHTPASRLLRDDHLQSMRAFARMFGLHVNWAVHGAFAHSLRTGLPATEIVAPGGYWSYYADHPDDAAIFNGAMEAKAHGHVAAVTSAYDFSRFGTIADIGGGRGHLLAAILQHASTARGVLFDLPHVIADATVTASERLTLLPGDFFRDALPAADAYLLMEVIHDWADAEALNILQAIRRAAPPHATLLLIEQMVPDHPGPDWSKLLDIHMLALLGGRQRTRAEYGALLRQAGFALQRELPTFAGVSILEAVLT